MDILSKPESLIGSLNSIKNISGSIENICSLNGKLSTNVDTTVPYIGEYQVTPKAFSSQKLNTANKMLYDDIVVNEVPYFENENFSKGLTVYIAKEV